MTCAHGLDEINCPICRIDRVSFPKEMFDVKIQDLKPKNPFTVEFSKDIEVLNKDLGLRIKIPEPFSVNLHSTPNLSLEPPIFSNELFLKRLKEIDVSKSDTFGITKKTSLLTPEFKLEKEK